MTVYFTREHEWIRVEGDTATVGISDHAQEALGDIVFAEVPEAGRKTEQGPGSGRRRIREGGFGRLFAGRGRSDRRQSGRRRRSGAHQPRPGRRGLVLQAEARQSGRGRRADGRSRPIASGWRRFERRHRLDQPLECGGLCPGRPFRRRPRRGRARFARSRSG